MAKKLKIDLHTGAAFLIWAALLTWAYFKPNEYFGTYAIWLTTGLGAITGKRLIQKRKEYNGSVITKINNIYVKP